MDLLQLEHFLAVVEEGTRAAERVSRSQPAVSQSTRTLEDEIGGHLFSRDLYGVSLNDAGKALVEYTLAPGLQGKLFFAHGDVDENVSMPATIKLVDALVKANRDFDFVIMPNRPHGFGNDPHFVRRRWDYFVKNLLDLDPSPGFSISEPTTTSTSQYGGAK